jgi:hypothetical protein
MNTITTHYNMYNMCLFTSLRSKETFQGGEYTTSVTHFPVSFSGVHLNILYNEYTWSSCGKDHLFYRKVTLLYILDLEYSQQQTLGLGF